MTCNRRLHLVSELEPDEKTDAFDQECVKRDFPLTIDSVFSENCEYSCISMLNNKYLCKSLPHTFSSYFTPAFNDLITTLIGKAGKVNFKSQSLVCLLQSSWKQEKKSKNHSNPILVRSVLGICLLYTSPSPRDGLLSRMPSSA